MKLRNWRQIRDRLMRADRAELRDRIRQELAKREDGLRSRFGYGRQENARSAGKIKEGNFFFRAESVDSILDVLRQRLPLQVQEIIHQADAICQHRFDLLGYKRLDYESSIDWHLDLVHAKRAPRKLFYKVRYLDFDEVGDSKITWELNRHQHLVTLAKAYRLTRDKRYADEILCQWRHWHTENPYPTGINWASSLELAFRSLSWLWTHFLLQDAQEAPDFRAEWLRSMALHGRHMERYLSTYFSPNTHLLGEGVGLFFIGVLCPELASAERWRQLGWRIVVKEAGRQVQADGFHFEQSVYYHLYAVDFLLHFTILARVNNVAVPPEFEKILENMLTALFVLGRCGSPPRFGDDDGGRLFDPRRNGSECLLDPLAIGAVLFNRGDYKLTATNLTEEAVWLLGADGVSRWDSLQATSPAFESTALSSAGFYVLTAPNKQLIVQAGSQGSLSGGHSHADALSVCLQSGGRELLVDPGTFEYVGPDGDRDRFRGTRMHNTLLVDQANQAETASSFSWKRRTQCRAEQWAKGVNFDLVVASHDGYQRLTQPVVHRRWVLSLKNGLFMVRDVVEGAGIHELEIIWNLGQDLQPVSGTLYQVSGTSERLAILPAEGNSWSQDLRNECRSPRYGQKAPMTVLSFSTTCSVPTEFGTLLLTLDEGDLDPGVFVRIPAEPGSTVSAYKYSSKDKEYRLFFAPQGEVWSQGVLSSDAAFVCWSPRDQAALILCNGSYAAVEGGPELHFERQVSWGEFIQEGDKSSVFSSDPCALPNDVAL